MILFGAQSKGGDFVPDWLHIVVRALTALIILFVLTRILGKKQISQLTFFEYVIGVSRYYGWGHSG
jgi:hypothetical protein